MANPDCLRLPSSVQPTLSLEFFPARGESHLANNVIAVRQLLKTNPDFVSVTYGASGSSQLGSRDLVSWIVDEHVATYAHLTCYATSLAELRRTIIDLLSIGVTGILALRGDTPAAGERLVLPHANYLVALIREIADDLGRDVAVAVAVFPGGHPESRGLGEDIATLRRKQDVGATFAITQNFYEVDDYVRFVEAARDAGITLEIVPGLMLSTSTRQLERISELSAVPIPTALYSRLAAANDDEAARRDIAVDTTTELARQLLDIGAPGIQLFTMNNAPTTVRVLERLRATRAFEAPRTRRAAPLTTEHSKGDSWQRTEAATDSMGASFLATRVSAATAN